MEPRDDNRAVKQIKKIQHQTTHPGKSADEKIQDLKVQEVAAGKNTPSLRNRSKHLVPLEDSLGSTPCAPHHKPGYSGNKSLIPPPALLDIVDNFLKDIGYVKAARRLATENQEDDRYKTSIWRGTSAGMPSLTDIFLQWQKISVGREIQLAGEGSTLRQAEGLTYRVDGTGSGHQQMPRQGYEGTQKRRKAKYDGKASLDSMKSTVHLITPAPDLVSLGDSSGGLLTPHDSNTARKEIKRKAFSLSHANSRDKSTTEDSSDLTTSSSDSESDHPSSSDSSADVSESSSEVRLGSPHRRTSIASKLVPDAQRLELVNPTNNRSHTMKSKYKRKTESSSTSSSDPGSDSDSESDEDSEDDTEVPTSAAPLPTPFSTPASASHGDGDSDSESDSSGSSSSNSEVQVREAVAPSTKDDQPLRTGSTDSSATIPKASSPSKSVTKIICAPSSESSSDSDSAIVSPPPTKSEVVSLKSKTDSRKRKRSSPTVKSRDLILTGAGEKVKRLKRDVVPFSRIPENIKVDEKFASNKYRPYDFAEKAHQDLAATRGKGFTKEKNKKKRGSYRGGTIDTSGGKGIKFTD